MCLRHAHSLPSTILLICNICLYFPLYFVLSMSHPFPIPCLMSPVHCPLLPVPCPPFPVPCLLSSVSRALSPCSSFLVPCSLSPVPLSPVSCPLLLVTPSPSSVFCVYVLFRAYLTLYMFPVLFLTIPCYCLGIIRGREP